jgi:hypothetical protein
LHWLLFMYRCQLCGRVVPAGTPARRVVVRTRAARYPFRSQANRVVRPVNGKPRVRYTDDPGGAGSAIVAERIACPDCADGRPAAP